MRSQYELPGAIQYNAPVIVPDNAGIIARSLLSIATSRRLVERTRLAMAASKRVLAHCALNAPHGIP